MHWTVYFLHFNTDRFVSMADMTVCLIMCLVWKFLVNTFKVTLKLGICSFIIKIRLNLYYEFDFILAYTHNQMSVPISHFFSVLLCIYHALIFVQATWGCGKSMEMGKGILVLFLSCCVTLDKSLKLQICSPEDWTG